MNPVNPRVGRTAVKTGERPGAVIVMKTGAGAAKIARQTAIGAAIRMPAETTIAAMAKTSVLMA